MLCHKVLHRQSRDVSPAPTQCLISSENEEMITQPNSIDPTQTKAVFLENLGAQYTLFSLLRITMNYPRALQKDVENQWFL
jgi:hypothetical protein